MRTRSAAHKATEVAAEDAAIGPTIMSPLDPKPAVNGPKPPPRPKRKRSTPSTTQPVKGGWDVLPHGMGTLPTAGIATGHPQASHDLDTANVRDTSSIRVAETAKATKTTGGGPTRQARLVLRVTKVAAQTPKEEDAPTKGSSVAEIAATGSEKLKNEDKEEVHPTGGEGEGEGGEDGRHAKRRRITRAATKAAQYTALVNQETEAPSVSNVKCATAVGSNKSNKDEPSEITIVPQPDPDFRMRVKRGAGNPYGLTPGYSPYPHRSGPTPEACEKVHTILTELHGHVTQPRKAPAPSLEVAGCGEVPSVLDALLRTLISGNTLMARADEAIRGLVKKFGILEDGIGAGSINWNKVRLSSLEDLVGAIKPAGCAQVKGGQIKAILDMVHEENMARAEAHMEAKATETDAPVAGAENESEGQKALEVEKASQSILSLDHYHSMNREDAMAGFLKYPGIGVKTAACVILFCLRIPCFAVDTHVHRFCQWLEWVPAKATELDSFNHGEFKVPDHLKYGLHQLFIRHGQQCFKCRKATKPGTSDWNEAPDCPLEHLLDRSKDRDKDMEGTPETLEE